MRPFACDRSRAWISLRLDDELSKFEHVLLGAHLAVCRDCRRFEHDVTWQTSALREAPLERPSLPVSIPSTRTWRWPALGVSTAAVAASVLALAIGLRSPGPARPASGGPLSTAAPAKRADALGSRGEGEARTVHMPGGIALRGDPLGG